MHILRGFIGLMVIVGISFLLSRDRKNINWRLVATGVGLQLVLALLVFKVEGVSLMFKYMAGFFTELLKFTDEGAKFVFGEWPDLAEIFAVKFVNGEVVAEKHMLGYVFAFKVLPTIVFFSALTSFLYYIGLLQKIVFGFAWIMSKTMKLSGSESLSAAANIFIGQTEAPLVVKPYIEKMTKSEIMCLMTGGMATIAGGVFAAFISMLGGSDPVAQTAFGTHLLTASILSAPAAIVIAKILYPETQEVNKNLIIQKEKIGSNPLDAISLGTTDGVKLAVNVGAMLLVFTAFVAMINYIFTDIIGANSGLNDLVNHYSQGQFKEFSLEAIFGYIFAPLGWVIGITGNDMLLAGQLIGEKTILNEFIAYNSLSNLKQSGLFEDSRSIVIMTYALCGFANIASIGIQIGGIGTIAPNQRPTLSKLGVLALIGGTFACLMTATVAGIFIS